MLNSTFSLLQIKTISMILHNSSIILGWAFTFFLLPVQGFAQSSVINETPNLKNGLSVEKMTDNLGVIWAMDFLDDDQIIFTIREGKAGIFNIKTQKVNWLQGLPEVHDLGQGGLLDVAVWSVETSSNVFEMSSVNSQVTANENLRASSKPSWLYFTYSKSSMLQGKTTLARAQLNGYKLVNWQDLLVTESASLRNIHFGSRIAFDHLGHVFFTIGDRGVRDNAQNLQNHAGTVLRLNLDGTIPKDNPFIDHPTAKPEIWSYGHRNPQGLVYDFKHKRLWSIEHGPRGGDEINLIEKAKNYGWPVVSKGQEYFTDIDVGASTRVGMQDPIKVYTPSIAPSDLVIYQHDLFSGWRGDLLSGALKLRHLNRVTLNADFQATQETRYLQNRNERIRSVLQGKTGELWLGTDSGKILRVTPN